MQGRFRLIQQAVMPPFRSIIGKTLFFKKPFSKSSCFCVGTESLMWSPWRNWDPAGHDGRPYPPAFRSWRTAGKHPQPRPGMFREIAHIVVSEHLGLVNMGIIPGLHLLVPFVSSPFANVQHGGMGTVGVINFQQVTLTIQIFRDFFSTPAPPGCAGWRADRGNRPADALQNCHIRHISN